MAIYSEESWLLCALCSEQSSEARNLGVHCIWPHSFDVYKFKTYSMRCWYKSKSTLQFFSLLLIDSFFLCFVFVALCILMLLSPCLTYGLQKLCHSAGCVFELRILSFAGWKLFKVCTHFTIVLFTVATPPNKRNHPACSPIDESIKNVIGV